MNSNCTTLDALAPVGSLAVIPTEFPSASLNVHVAAGQYVKQDGTIGTFAGASSQGITSNVTRVLYLDGTNSWVLTVNTAYPTTPHVRLATVVTGSSTITSITDNRQCFMVCGSIADGVNLTLGSSTGTQIGTATTQKLGFYGATPIVQPAGSTDLRTALINLGLYASGGATPLNLNGGVLSAGSATIADGGNVSVGTTTGTQIGTATNQKLAFYGKTPVIQQTMGSMSAGNSYSSNEQTMLQTLWNLMRTLGFGS
ncbi:MAG TPA: hypothetical protein VKA15_26845 [Isosphaeraceae bacterium]|nr:hypothetical protein [Isosphaeraceae bacterium]